MNFGSALKILREARNLSQPELAEILGLSRSTISMYENNNRQPDFEILEMLADYFNVDMNTLLGNSIMLDESSAPQGLKRVPVLGVVAAGEPIVAIENIEDYIEVSSSLPGEHFALIVKGRSMEPRMVEGDIVLVRKQSDVPDKAVAVVIEDGDNATVKRVQKSKDGITLVANNPSVYSAQFYSNKQIENGDVQIIGEVIEVRGKP